jgi:hypothetical protein
MKRSHLVLVGTVVGTAAVLAFPVQGHHLVIPASSSPTTTASPADSTTTTTGARRHHAYLSGGDHGCPLRHRG